MDRLYESLEEHISYLAEKTIITHYEITNDKYTYLATIEDRGESQFRLLLCTPSDNNVEFPLYYDDKDIPYFSRDANREKKAKLNIIQNLEIKEVQIKQVKEVKNSSDDWDDCEGISFFGDYPKVEQVHTFPEYLSPKILDISTSDYESNETIAIEKLLYDPNSNIFEAFKKDLDIIYIALNLIKKHFPCVKSITQRDKYISNKYEDRNVHGAVTSMTLATIYWCIYKKSWQDNLFGAKLVHPEHQIKYEENSMLLDTIIISSHRYFNRYFYRDEYRPFLQKLEIKYGLLFESIFKEDYTSVISLINTLVEKITDKKELYDVLNLFVYPAIRENLSIYEIFSEWIFSMDTVPIIEFKEKVIDNNPYYDNLKFVENKYLDLL